MATKASKPKWSAEEVEVAEHVLDQIKKTVDTGTVTDKYAQVSITARALGYLTTNQTFKHLPPEIKSYIEYVWWLESDQGQKNTTAKRVQENLAQMEADWKEQYENNPDFRRAMTHPDDEV